MKNTRLKEECPVFVEPESSIFYHTTMLRYRLPTCINYLYYPLLYDIILLHQGEMK